MPQKPTTTSIVIPVSDPSGHSEGSWRNLVGIAYVPGTDTPAPLAVLLHGIPGSEKNHDVARALQEGGWIALVLHFSGAWGSGGVYDMSRHPQDAIAALDHMLGEDAPAVVDTSRVALIGYSLGSRAALVAGHLDARVTHVVSIGGIADFNARIFDESFFDGMTPFLKGATIPRLIAGFQAFGRDQFQPNNCAAKLAPRPVLVIHGRKDEVVPPQHADALAAGGDHIQQVWVDGANHAFGGVRHALLSAIVAFLENT
ncbi:MAG: prolyl oligopeptidase family serine peptidase [Chloroflexota bacterium]